MENSIDISKQHMGSDETSRSMTQLAAFATNIYSENIRFRQTTMVDQMLLDCKYAAAGEYSPTDKAKRSQKGLPMVYDNLSDTKRRAAQAWIGEIFLNSADKPYELHPSPIPDMPEALEKAIASSIVQEWASIVSPEPPQTPEELEAVYQMAQKRRDEIENLIREEAEKRAARMDRVVHDRLVEGRWREEMTKAIEYMSTYGTAVVKMVKRRRKRLVRKVNKYGVSEYSVKFDTKMELQAIDPIDCYPSKGAQEIEDGYFCQRIRLTPYELRGMEGEKGAFPDAIEELIQTYTNGLRTYQSTDSEVETLNKDGPTSDIPSTLEGFEFWGRVIGRVLINQGVSKDNRGKDIDKDAFYDIDCIVINGLVVMCDMIDPRLGRPLFKGKFYDVLGSWWGEGPITKMKHIQAISNGALTSLVWNMAQAAGPQIAITDIDRMEDTDYRQEPWKVWLFRRATNGSTDIPMKFFQANSNSAELLAIMDRMEKSSDTITGIPAYAYGSDQAAGAGRTASGLSMLMDAAQRGIKHVIFSLDLDLMRPIIQYIVTTEMITNPDEGIKGDIVIDAGGILSVLTKDKSRNQLLEILNLCANPLVAQVVGEDGIANLMHKIVSLVPHINPDDVVPTEEEREFRKIKAQLEALRQMQMQQQLALQSQAQAAQAGLDPSQVGHVQPQTAGEGQGIPLQDGVANVAALGGQTPGSAYNQFQPNAAMNAHNGAVA